MPGISAYWLSVGCDPHGKPLPTPEPQALAPEPQPEPPPVQPEAAPGLTPTGKMHAALLLDAVKRAIGKPVINEEPAPAEDPAVTRNREILTGEAEPTTLSELARAARWGLNHPEEIEGY